MPALPGDQIGSGGGGGAPRGVQGEAGLAGPGGGVGAPGLHTAANIKLINLNS